MRLVQILGTGCAKCEQLRKNVEQAVAASGVEAMVEKVTDINQIISFGVMVTPAVVVDGEVKSVGKVLTPEEAAKLLQ